jgi:hypothetical protein
MFATRGSVAPGYRRGFRFLSLVMPVPGPAVAVPPSWAAPVLRAPPGAGYA